MYFNYCFKIYQPVKYRFTDRLKGDQLLREVINLSLKILEWKVPRIGFFLYGKWLSLKSHRVIRLNAGNNFP